MTPDGTGRFCSTCNKTVIDFTGLSDEEVLAIIQRSKEKICGRFGASQLDRDLHQQKRHQNTLLPAVMITSSLVAGALSPVNGMAWSTDNLTQPYGAGKGQIAPAVSQFHPASEDEPVSHLPATDGDTLLPIAGKVRDLDSGRAVALAFVGIKGTTFHTYTDNNGNFRLLIPDTMDVHDVILHFSGASFSPQEINLCTIPNLQQVDVFMGHDGPIIKELEGVVGGVTVVRPSLWQRIKRLFR
jgi:hypothetical protein